MSDTVPCKYCGKPTVRTHTQLCDPCWEVVRAVERDPELARRALAEIDKATTKE